MSESFWSRYKSAIHVKKDFREVFIRPHERYATLDGARAITILGMVLFHVLFGIVKLLEDNIDNVERFIFSFPDYFNWMWQSQGSDPLFVMCGLLVAYTLYREYDKTQDIQVLRFYKRRLMRVVPLFLVALLIYLPTDLDHFGYIWSNLLFISNYIPGHRHIIPVGWSLDVQLQFYFMLPFLIFLMFAVRWRIGLLVGLFIASVAWRYYVVVSDPQIYQTPFYQIIYDGAFARLLADKLYYDIDVRIGAFILGMLVAYLHYYYGKQLKAFFSRHMIINTLLVIAGFAMIVVALSQSIEDRTSSYYENFNPTLSLWFLVADRYVYSLGLSLVLLMALCPVGIGRWVNWVLSWPIWHPVAQLIFPIYLFHFIFIVLGAVLTFWTVDRHSIVEVHTYQVFLIFFWTVLLTMAFSTLVHIFIEKPFLTMRERIPTKAPAPAPSPATM